MKYLLLMVLLVAIATTSINAEGACDLPFQKGRRCRGLDIPNLKIPRYYYDSGFSECVKFDYPGCMGNANNFSSKEDCEAECKGEWGPGGPP